MGEYEKTVEDRPYTHSEIQTLIQHASPRNKAIILLMSSGGLRVGAISLLRIKDLEPIDKYNIYKISVYSKSRKSRYFSFCTPETRNAITSYLDYRRRWGERIGEESPVFRVEFNSQLDNSNAVKPISMGLAGENPIRASYSFFIPGQLLFVVDRNVFNILPISAGY
jgi:integrase